MILGGELRPALPSFSQPWEGKTMRIGLVLAGILFIVATAKYAVEYNATHWKTGRYGMPASALGPSGKTYLDGSPVDPIILELIRNGEEEKVYLAIFGMTAVVLLGTFLWQLRRDCRKITALKRESKCRVEAFRRMLR
jgi:hypothetical protein